MLAWPQANGQRQGADPQPLPKLNLQALRIARLLCLLCHPSGAEAPEHPDHGAQGPEPTRNLHKQNELATRIENYC